MKSVPSMCSRFASLAVLLATMENLQSIQAASATWLAAPANNNWLSPSVSNWSTGAGTFPGATTGSFSTDIATFSANSTITTIDCASAFVIGGITFDTANASAYTINTGPGTWRISVNNGAIATVTITSTVTNKQTINGQIRMATSGGLNFVSNAATNVATLNILGGCSANNTGTGGTLILSGSNTGPNVMGAFTEQAFTTAPGTLIKTNTGLWILNTNSTYHGNTTVVGGTLMLAGSGAIPNSANFIINNGTLNVTNLSNPNNMWVTNSGIVAVTNTTLNQAQLTIGTLTTSNATFQLGVNGNWSSTANISVSSTLNAGPHITLAITKVVNCTSPTTFNLISYGGADPNPANFTVTVPQGFTASSVSASSGEVSVTVTPPTVTALVWVGATNSVLVNNWDTNKTQNWIDQATMSVPQAYVNPDPVQFDDSAANGTVTLITTNTPESVTVNNNNLNYTFNGAGKISGLANLIKEGNGTLTLADKGDDFAGGITVYGGTLILDNTNGNISGGLVFYGGTTVQVGNSDTNGTLPSGSFDDEGALVFQRSNDYTVPMSLSGNGTLTQNGTGILTINNTNQLYGNITVAQGTLALAGSGEVSEQREFAGQQRHLRCVRRCWHNTA